MFRALLAHLQEALHQRHLVYCVSVMSVGCTWIGGNSNAIVVQPTDIVTTTRPKNWGGEAVGTPVGE
jgi:hypothetical protein